MNAKCSSQSPQRWARWLCLWLPVLLAGCTNPYAVPAHSGRVPFDKFTLGQDVSLELGWRSGDKEWLVDSTAEVYLPYVAMTALAKEELLSAKGKKDELLRRVKDLRFYAVKRSADAAKEPDYTLVCQVDTTILGQSLFIACHPERANPNSIVLRDFDFWSSITAPVLGLATRERRIAWRKWVGDKLQAAINDAVPAFLRSPSQGAAIDKVQMRDWLAVVTVSYQSLPNGEKSRWGHPRVEVRVFEN